ncbi:MAG: FAD:protein FMN transferase [Bacteroidetes bacterium]|nr:FAD:protein FMN transferase [Bacteroidota bacterium]MDA0904202.1 FAD:protein FMN transferase [Bacteroidota bacterium]MDA1242952.1 FAD:protein FMN transferase [Bacteroidota bacterium]
MTSVAKPSVVRITKALALAGAFVALGCGSYRGPNNSDRNVWEHRGDAQGTTYLIKYVAKDSVPQVALNQALESVDVEMNAWRAESTLSQFNAMARADSAFVIVDADSVWRDLWTLSSKVHFWSDGALDISMAPLMKLWGFRTQHRDVVTEAMVDSVRQFSGWREGLVHMEECHSGQECGLKLTKAHPRVALDFNAVAQGYTVDLLCRVLRSHGVVDAMVELGGEVRCMGQNEKGNPWRIAIDRPQREGRSLQAIVGVQNMAICTSGNYRKSVEVNGVKMSHTLDPRTGSPVTHSLLSATIMMNEAAEADACATACMVMGPDKGRDWIEQLKQNGQVVEAMFIFQSSDGEMVHWTTPWLEEQLEWVQELPAGSEI